ncbi:MAG: 30S ribosomal protein S6 [Candidatus Zophobacter franzmannii]|jgi:small subunit ribosomal protein S6|nr:30S ribosomal protein S6 [Candidatus Zophobacter franzmannii]
MNKYESMLILDGVISKEDAQAENQKVIDLITQLGGEVLETLDWGKRQLAYEIEKKNQGYFYVNTFMLPTDKMLDIERNYKLNEQLIRFNMIVLEKN